MLTLLYTLHFIVCFILIGVVLLQRGKGADLGASLGGGGANTIFGSRGAGNFLTKITTGAAITFMCTSMALAYFAAGTREGERLFDPDAMETPAAAPGPQESESPFGEFGDFGEAPAEAPSDAGADAPAQGTTPAP